MGKSTMAMPIVPINALFDDELRASLSADYLTFIQEADVIFGVDVMSEREFLLYGRRRWSKSQHRVKLSRSACFAYRLTKKPTTLRN
jgi:hypothetical protein